MKRSYKIGIIVALQVLFLFSMLGIRFYTLSQGVPVLLKAAPVDPWDLFRGEYVALNYDISTVKSDGLDIPRDGSINKKVYVVLEKGEQYWNTAGVFLEKPALKSDQVFIKGQISYYNDREKEFHISYGIESYYVEEGMGREINRQENLEAQVRIDHFGNAAIEKILY